MDSKEIRRWAIHHTAWELTGANVWELLRDEIKRFIRPCIAGGLMSALTAWFTHSWSVAFPYVVALSVLAFVAVLFVWDMASTAKQHVPPAPLITDEGASMQLDGARAEILEIRNDGPATATGIFFSHVDLLQVHHFTLCRSIPDVPPRNRIKGAYVALNLPGGQTLREFVREHPELKATATVAFRDQGNHHFRCVYNLSAAPGGTLIWNPSEVMPLKSEDGRSK
jgi:hypothetical protein